MIKEKLNSIDEFIETIPVKHSTARAWIHQGRLPVLRIGRRVFVRQSTIEQILEGGLESIKNARNVRI